MRDVEDLLKHIVRLDECSPIPKCIVCKEDEAHRSHLLVALGFVDGHSPLRLRMHVCVVEDVVVKLDHVLVELGDNKDLLMFQNPQPYVWLPYGWKFVLMKGL